MKALYKGPYKEDHVNYRGVAFSKGVAAEVSDEFFEANKEKLEIEKKRAKRKAK